MICSAAPLKKPVVLGFKERAPGIKLEARIDWFAFEREDSEDTFVHAAQRFPAHETLRRFDL